MPEALKSYTVNGAQVKLGRNIPPQKRLAPRFEHYTVGSLPPVPPSVDWSKGVPKWPMYKNDVLGICVLATLGHHFGLWSALSSPPELLYTDAEMIEGYSAVGGYVPGRPETDNGCVIQDALDWVCRTGLGVRRDKAAAYCSVDVGETLTNFLCSANIFGGNHIGLNLPWAWSRNTGPGKVWDVGSGPDYRPGSWGGHSVPFVAFDKSANEGLVVTWAAVQRITFRALQRYCDEAWALIAPEWVDGSHPAPSGFDLAAVIEDFHAFGGGDVPIPPGPPTPPPPTAGTIALDLDKKTYSFPPGWSPAGGP